MQRDQRIIMGQGVGPIGAFRNRQADHQRVGEQTTKSDGDAILPVTAKQIASPKQAGGETTGRACVKAEHHPRIKSLAEIKR